MWWEIHGEAIQTYKPATRQIINKFLFDQWATNTREYHMHPYRTEICEMCGTADETTDHVLQCQTDLQAATNKLHIQEVKDYFQESETPISVMTCIIQGLEAWYNQLDPPVLANIVPNAPQGLQQAYTDQTIIGWRHFLRGRLARSWEIVIQAAIDNRVRNVGTKQKKKRIFSAKLW